MASTSPTLIIHRYAMLGILDDNGFPLLQQMGIPKAPEESSNTVLLTQGNKAVRRMRQPHHDQGRTAAIFAPPAAPSAPVAKAARRPRRRNFVMVGENPETGGFRIFLVASPVPFGGAPVCPMMRPSFQPS